MSRGELEAGTRGAVFSDVDHRFMDIALRLAERGLGNTWPNPSVGCLVVSKHGHIVGRGWTAAGGRPHAETIALSAAGPVSSQGATVYVTLEPCSHTGHTSPCTDALIQSGIARCVISYLDPDARVNGQGVMRLQQAGIRTDVGLLSERGIYVNRGFFSRVEKGRPLFTLKLASTLDGKIATCSGESRWITGRESRRFAHRLRAEHDGILVGSGTALKDNPDLRCRLDGVAKRDAERIVLDGRLRLSSDLQLALTAQDSPVVVVTRSDADDARKDLLRRCGIDIVELEALSPSGVAEALAARGLTRILIEGGASISASFLRESLVDSLVWFHSSAIIGGDGQAAVDSIGALSLSQRRLFTRRVTNMCGDDHVTCLDRAS